ncbi:MAG: hypothetical protein IE881_03085 [Epsilonproteobacteria bacterium]|nr:hypothetical protein [Campylobacterota bacterium]
MVKIVATSVIALALISGCSSRKISEDEIKDAQEKWGECIVEIGTEVKDYEKAKEIAQVCIDELYAYDEESGVAFKPTKASALQFRTNKEDALSYFVGGKVAEDHGFALQPWSKVRFENIKMITDNDSAIAMGNYYFTDAKTKQETKVEYTFGYTKEDGDVKINLHHSSLPFTPTPKH